MSMNFASQSFLRTNAGAWLALIVALLVAPACRRAEPSSPLAVAAVAGDEARVLRLLTDGADVLARDADGLSAAHWAARRGPPPTLRLLLAAGTPPDLRDDHVGFGWTLLVSCAHSGRPDTFAALLEAGADPDAVSGDGTTALVAVLFRSDLELSTRAEMLGLLVEADADVPDALSADPSILGRLVAAGESELVERLLDAAPDARLGHAFCDHFARALLRLRGEHTLLARLDGEDVPR